MPRSLATGFTLVSCQRFCLNHATPSMKDILSISSWNPLSGLYSSAAAIIALSSIILLSFTTVLLNSFKGYFVVLHNFPDFIHLFISLLFRFSSLIRFLLMEYFRHSSQGNVFISCSNSFILLSEQINLLT